MPTKCFGTSATIRTDVGPLLRETPRCSTDKFEVKGSGSVSRVMIIRGRTGFMVKG